mgnify:CR=1 FL=1
MALIQACPLPPDALLARYAAKGAYADCYAIDVPGPVSFPAFVEAFYTGAFFKLELGLLGLIGKPSSNQDARRLAAGEIGNFSGWRVEDRAADQLMMCDLGGGLTRSWLMAAPAPAGGTRLYFGSAVLPKRDKATGETRMSALFTPLLGFHRLYSRILLSDARARLAAS